VPIGSVMLCSALVLAAFAAAGSVSIQQHEAAGR